MKWINDTILVETETKVKFECLILLDNIGTTNLNKFFFLLRLKSHRDNENNSFSILNRYSRDSSCFSSMSLTSRFSIVVILHEARLEPLGVKNTTGKRYQKTGTTFLLFFSSFFISFSVLSFFFTFSFILFLLSLTFFLV